MSILQPPLEHLQQAMMVYTWSNPIAIGGRLLLQYTRRWTKRTWSATYLRVPRQDTTARVLVCGAHLARAVFEAIMSDAVWI